MPRIFDNNKLNKWNIENKQINIIFKEVNDYVEEKFLPIKKTNNTSSGYRPPSCNIESGQSFIKQEPEYKLDSNDDFPSL
tara:strand:+ start:652 stop:891 length:240 start_codon:yes stop_codon:yes gene_type:complete